MALSFQNTSFCSVSHGAQVAYPHLSAGSIRPVQLDVSVNQPPSSVELGSLGQSHGAETELSEKLKCLYTNARSLCNKIELLKLRDQEVEPHIVGITETWCREGILDSEVALRNFVFF